MRRQPLVAREPEPGRRGGQRVHHALADSARRDVDHPPQAHVVVRIEEQLQVRQRVLDFLPLVEPDAADDAVRDALAAQRVLDDPRLRVGPVEDGHRRVARRAHRRPRDARDGVGLLEFVIRQVVADLVAAGPVRPEPLLLAVAVLTDDRGRGIQDDLRRPIVALEAHHPRFGVVGLEVHDVPQVRAPPLVDRLVRVADDAEIAVGFGEPAHQQILRPVRVLVLVHEQEAESVRVAGADRRLVEEVDRSQQQVVEVERVGVGERALVRLEDPTELLVVRVVAARERLGAEHQVLGVADAPEHGLRLEQAVVDGQLAHHLLHRRHLVGRIVDDEIAREADGGSLAPEQAGAHRVERRHPRTRRRVAQQRRHALPHLFGRLVCERDRDHLAGVGVARANQVGDAVGDDARLPGPGAGQNEQRAVDLQHRLALFGVEFVRSRQERSRWQGRRAARAAASRLPILP